MKVEDPRRAVIGALLLTSGVLCYQKPSPDQNGLLMPSPWNVPNYVKNWPDLSHSQTPALMGAYYSNELPNSINVNNNGEMEDRQLEKRQDTPQNVAAFAQEGVVDGDAATVAAMQFELQSLVQTKYQAEAAIKMESSEISRTQHEALEAERALEEATNNVRMISAHLKNAQEEASKAATRALTAQLQMSVHDQLLVSARQKLNSVTAHIIALEADLAGAQQRFMLSNSTKELENRAHALRLRPDLIAIASPNEEQSNFANNYQPQNIAGQLLPAEFWHPQDNSLPLVQQPPGSLANWPQFNQELDKSQHNPSMFMSPKKI